MDQRRLFFRLSSFSAMYPGAEMWGEGFPSWNTKYVGNSSSSGLSHEVKVLWFILAFAIMVLLGSVSNLFSASCKFTGSMGSSLILAGWVQPPCFQ